MQRDQSLDALRGFAILTMILSGSIAYGGVMPAWMYHAQVPPPLHQFNPDLPGITWVDLVFPFFLFCMGAAIPLALNKYVSDSAHTFKVIWIAVRRFLLLALFALFFEQMKAWVINPNPGTKEYLFSLLGFVLLFFSFTRFPGNISKKKVQVINYLSLGLVVVCLFLLPLNVGRGFLKVKSDIIIMVLANMALFGTLAWWFTRNKPLLRLGILPFIMAIFLGSKESGSWNETIFAWSPESAFYTFYFLKYLFIIIPATFAGEWILRYRQENKEKLPGGNDSLLIALLSLILVVINVVFLFNRQLLLNLSATIILLLLLYYIISKNTGNDSLTKMLFTTGAYCLLLGLCFEAYEGGIKKDRSTYSYYFVTSGLAFFMLLFLAWLSGNKWLKWLTQFFSVSGKNPMLAYAAGSLLLIPLLQLSGLHSYWSGMNANAWIGFLKGLIFTITVCGITIFFTKKRMDMEIIMHH